MTEPARPKPFTFLPGEPEVSDIFATTRLSPRT
eukprot:CAMPEP_0114238802 /NCGR_PEP_ID=MMETSP0058-20121206/8115_1 /TAXON_ID=36894 /ORGANISM="Pyramimonas parkeae, CCMP726" /LENGTH=32 /DNA_ID= /DNA_START= /DNA_END= /DNA_ORIENTATION=